MSQCPHTLTRCSTKQQPPPGVRGCIRSTPTVMLPVVTRVTPPYIRRNKQCLALARLAEADDQHTLHTMVTTTAPLRKRLRSRHPFSEHTRCIISDTAGKSRTTWTNEAWLRTWDGTPCRLRGFIPIPSIKPVGHELSGHSLARLNQIRTEKPKDRPHSTLAVNVRYTNVTGTWSGLPASTRLALGPTM